MKKIATITFHNAINVGAVLQAYALQKAIESLGAESEVLDYRNAHVNKVYKPLYLQHRNVMWFLKTLLVAPVRFARNKRFEKFNKEYIKFSKQIKTPADFEEINSEYDGFIVGSDQVWNPYHTGSIDGRYFLDFVNDSNKKKSYAASFGLSELPMEFKDQYAQLLSGFSDMSVREPSAVNIVSSLIPAAKPDVVLDPVFLLDKSHWETMLVDTQKLQEQRYLLIFCVNGLGEDVISASRKVAEHQGLSIIYLARRPLRINGVKVVTKFAPREFLTYIRNADYVVTDSFHATSFSLIFEKQFSLKIAKQHGHVNNRSLELLGKLGVESRVLGQESGIIDWRSTGDRLNQERQSSMDYLKRAVIGDE